MHKLDLPGASEMMQRANELVAIANWLARESRQGIVFVAKRGA